NGMVVIRGDKIEAVGAGLPIPEGATVIDLGEAILTPGLIDARATYGMTGGENEEYKEVTPEVRAADSIDLSHPGFQRALRAGVTAAYVTPGTRNVISGAGAVCKTSGENRWLSERVAIQGTLGRDPTRGNRTPRSGRPRNFYYRRPTNRMGVTSIIRRALFEAGKEKDALGLAEALRGEIPLRFTARRSSDIVSALKLSSDYGFLLIIDDAGEAYRNASDIARANVPVILRVTVDPHNRSVAELGHVAVDSAAQLHRAGVRLALATWSDPGTAGPQDAAALAYRYGLPAAAALRAVTADAAEILGVSDRIGTLEKGKDADLVAFNGDPLQVTSRVSFVMIDGRVEFLSTTESASAGPTAAGETVPDSSPEPASMNRRP
ncbi:MAG: amidohydrolase family protein, partial [Planctomycetota bacterium]|nr:amidohydrolase family protein [Planctomycetota bacterium]